MTDLKTINTIDGPVVKYAVHNGGGITISITDGARKANVCLIESEIWPVMLELAEQMGMVISPKPLPVVQAPSIYDEDYEDHGPAQDRDRERFNCRQ